MATDKYVCKLDEELQAIARVELNEKPGEREKAIEKLRRWVKKENFVSGETCTDDRTLLKILRHSKFDQEKSRKRFQTHFHSRAWIQEWFVDRDPCNSTLREILKMGFAIPLKYDDKGRRIILNRLGHFDPAIHTVNDVMKAASIVYDFAIADEKTQINGTVGICDFSEFDHRHVIAYTPALRKVVMILQDCMPFRIKAVYCWNTPVVFNAVYAIAQLFMTKKLKERFRVLDKKEASLHAVIAPEYLPNEYGGTAGSLQSFIDLAEKEILQFRDRLLFDDDFVVIQKKKPEWEEVPMMAEVNLMF